MLWRRVLQHRSQTAEMTWERMLLPAVTIRA
jgi:hypothetical protein